MVVEMPGRCPKCSSRIFKRTSKKGYTYYACEKGAACGFMSWDVPTKDDCPVCGKTMFKLSGKGQRKPFCINEECSNFLPEDKRGYRRRASSTATTEEAGEEKTEKAKPAAKKTAAKTKSTSTRKKKEQS